LAFTLVRPATDAFRGQVSFLARRLLGSSLRSSLDRRPPIRRSAFLLDDGRWLNAGLTDLSAIGPAIGVGPTQPTDPLPFAPKNRLLS